MNDPLPDAIVEFRTQNGFDIEEEASTVWMATLGPLKLPLPNFRWRRLIIAQHDAHHILLGYDTSAKGELLVAAWEVGAGCYSGWQARALCITLMILGFCRYPTATRNAYNRGRTHRY